MIIKHKKPCPLISITFLCLLLIIGILEACAPDGQIINPSISKNDWWGENENWAKIDRQISSYYFVGYKSGSRIKSKIEAAYMRPRQYFIKYYFWQNDGFVEHCILHSDDNEAKGYLYFANAIFDISEQKHGFKCEPQSNMAVPLSGETELNQLFDCLETRFPIPPKKSRNLGKAMKSGKYYDSFEYKVGRKLDETNFDIDAKYLVDPEKGWPVKIEMSFAYDAYSGSESTQWLVNMFGARWPLVRKHPDHIEIRYEDIQYNVSENYIRSKFQIPNNANLSDGNNNNFACAVGFSNIIKDRFSGCKAIKN
jgi:hypothetical protein